MSPIRKSRLHLLHRVIERGREMFLCLFLILCGNTWDLSNFFSLFKLEENTGFEPVMPCGMALFQSAGLILSPNFP
jgi:hypothetical protein